MLARLKPALGSVRRKLSLDPGMLLLGLGSTTPWIVMGCLNTLLLPVLTTCYRLDAAVVAWAVTLPRILGMILDPLIGHFSDMTRSKWGRRKPYIAIGAIGCALSLSLMWWISPAADETSKIAYFAVTNLVLWISFSVYYIPYGALCYEFTEDYHERIKLMTINSWFCLLPGLGSGWLYWLALKPFFGGELNGVRAITLALIPVILVFSAGPLLRAHERIVRPVQMRPNLWKGLRETLRNQPFLYVLMIRASNALGVWIFNGMLFYINTFCVFGGDKTQGAALTAGSVTGVSLLSMVVMPLTPALGRHIGKRGLLIAGAACGVLGAIAVILLTQPSHPWAQVVAVALLAPMGFLQGIAISALMPDICDLDELQHGTRREGLFNAIVAALTKAEVAVAVLVVGSLINASGFVPTAVAQSSGTQLHLRLFGFGPFLICSLFSLFLATRFPLTEATTKLIQAELGARRATGEPQTFPS